MGRPCARLRHTELRPLGTCTTPMSCSTPRCRSSKDQNYFSRLAELFTIPRVRRATVAAGVVRSHQQMCGINIMASTPRPSSSRAAFTQTQALNASIGFGALNFVFAIPAIFTIDTYGRRTLCFSHFPNASSPRQLDDRAQLTWRRCAGRSSRWHVPLHRDCEGPARPGRAVRLPVTIFLLSR